jgi:guanine nucleotide-binding protein subunit alpha
MRVLLEGVCVMDLEVGTDAQDNWAAIMEAPVQIEGAHMPAHLANAIAVLWRDAGIQGAFARRNELQLNDSAP